MLGLALEGGGARGAFHMGAVKAFLEEGFEFNGIAGTSIGAINGAIIAQGDFEVGYKLWETMDNSLLFDVEQMQVQKLVDRKIDKETIAYLTAKIKEVIDNKGLDTSKMRAIIEDIIDEEKLRKSQIDLAIVTVSVPDLKPLELYKEDIPQGRMVAYLMASANFPVFKLEPLEGKFYLDGAFYDNCPINLLAKKGYQEVYAIRTFGPGIVRKVEDENIRVHTVIPSENLGRLLNFDNSVIQTNLQMGYFDTKRVLKNLAGRKYYIEPVNNEGLIGSLASIPEDTILKIKEIMRLPHMEPKRLLFEQILPGLAKLLDLPSAAGYQDIVVGLLEWAAEELGIEKYKIRTLEEFLEEIKTEEGKTNKLAASNTKRKFIFPAVFSGENVLRNAEYELLNAFLPGQFA